MSFVGRLLFTCAKFSKDSLSGSERLAQKVVNVLRLGVVLDQM